MSAMSTLKVAIQMDPPATINIHKDSTFILGLEAQKRGYQLFYYSPQSLNLAHGELTAEVSPLEFRYKLGDHFSLGSAQRQDLKDYDVILMRQNFSDPASYNATTHLLDHVRSKTLIVNDPTGTRESPEKLLITHFPDLAPPTLITRNLADIKAFQQHHPYLIIKPMNGFGGLDIYKIAPDDSNLTAVFEMLSRLHSEPFIVQGFIPEVKHGDKRIIVVEGEPIGAVLRVPNANEARANLAAGGQAVKAEITSREREICARLKPELIKRGLLFVGLDVIGDYVTEINPKSPTGLQEIYKLSGIRCELAIWNAIEARLENFQSSMRL